MRRKDKKEHMKRVNMLFEQRCNESKFSWDGKYANEEIKEDDKDDYHFPFNQYDSDNDVDYFDTEKLDEKTIMLGNDIEYVDENSEIEEEVTNITTDINDKTQFFSNTDAERRMDKNNNY